MILMYHKVHPSTPTIWWVSVDSFYKQMLDLRAMDVVYLDDYSLDNPNQVVITFDGVYQNILTFAAPIMYEFGFPFELFVTSDTIGKGNEFDTEEPFAEFASIKELEQLVKMGGRIQWHTKTHPNMENIINIKEIDNELSIPEEFRSIDASGNKWFAYPYGNFNSVVRERVAKYFNGAVSCIQGNDQDIYSLNRVLVADDTSLAKEKLVVIIASYNYGSFLIEALESVLRQTYSPHEILITDDCSNDNTQEIAEEYVRKYPGLIKYNRNSKNLGVVKNFNKAVSLTSSEFICFLGADNRLKSNYLEECVKILNSEPDTAIAYTDYAYFGHRAELAYNQLSDERKGGVKDNYYYLVTFPEFNDSSKEELKNHNFIHGSSMYRRKAFEEVGEYVDSSGMQEDFNLFQRIVFKGWGAKKANKTSLEYRQHSREQVNNKFNSYAELLFYKERALLYKSELEKIKSAPLWKMIYYVKNKTALLNNRWIRLKFFYTKFGVKATISKLISKVVFKFKQLGK